MTALTTAPAPAPAGSAGSAASTVRSRGRSAANRRTPAAWLVLAAFAVLALAMLAPVALAALNAVKSSEEYVRNGALALPEGFDLTNLIGFWNSVDFTGKLLNSVLISGGVAVLGTALSLLTAYAIGIGRVRGRFWILAAFMVAFTLPQEALVYPLYLFAKATALYDTQLAVIIILGVLQSAFGTYLLSAVLATVPEEVLEAARLDGAGRMRILLTIVTPMMRPTLTVLATFFFVWTWNEFFLPLVLLVSSRTQTVSVALGSLFGQYTSDPVTTAAAAVTGILPALLFFLVFQRTLMRGVNIGAAK